MITGIELPLELAVLLSAGFAAAGTWAGRGQANRKLAAQRNPLQELMRAERPTELVDLASRRNARRSGSQAVLHGRIDQFASLRTVWSVDTSDEVREHVIAVMRAGLRRGDRMALVDGEAFTITLPGVDERAAVRVADRLRRTLTRLNLPQLNDQARLTASFGVAAQRFGDGGDTLVQRARRALEAAVAKGADHVVPASEIEEVMLLPPPTPATPSSPTASAA